MPAFQLIMIMLIAAVGCWALTSMLIALVFHPAKPVNLLGIKIQGILPYLQAEMSHEIAGAVYQQFVSTEKLQAAIDNAGLMESLRPQVEKHVDQFLQVKLKEAFPLLANFMGEKTLSKFKVAFLEEVELLLPELIRENLGPAVEKMQLKNMIASNIEVISIFQLKKLLYDRAGTKIKLLKLAAALFGLLIGLIQALLLMLFFNPGT